MKAPKPDTREPWNPPPQPLAGPGEQRPQHFQDEDEPRSSVGAQALAARRMSTAGELINFNRASEFCVDPLGIMDPPIIFFARLTNTPAQLREDFTMVQISNQRSPLDRHFSGPQNGDIEADHPEPVMEP